MTGVDLYFVGFCKHSSIQHLEAGPFIKWEQAKERLAALVQPLSGRYVLCKMTLNGSVEEDG